MIDEKLKAWKEEHVYGLTELPHWQVGNIIEATLLLWDQLTYTLAEPESKPTPEVELEMIKQKAREIKRKVEAKFK